MARRGGGDYTHFKQAIKALFALAGSFPFRLEVQNGEDKRLPILPKLTEGRSRKQPQNSVSFFIDIRCKRFYNRAINRAVSIAILPPGGRIAFFVLRPRFRISLPTRQEYQAAGVGAATLPGKDLRDGIFQG